ncbi:flagellar hook-length control protein FliK [Nocardioides jishulii]|uniref:Flagellar hook-length control protein FliK n=1 Tax=Nocardioides jishulii TaxID=2575440 RepID=A0A4U2YSL1_9ACTN|nr:flagellar hook-length control protein FliK [Nocardioides jishulii]QCX28591.1 flagellar hook-length control protein FliK [Nocardioides jishulii]TKI64516.1 flagellar hook-length control protein FliK [Nocardioides jishulii]
MTALPPLPASAAPAASAAGPSASSGAGSGGFLEMLLAALPGAAVAAPTTPATPTGTGTPTGLTGLPSEASDATVSRDQDADAETGPQAETEPVLPVPFSATPPVAVTEAVRLAEAPTGTTTDATEPRTDESGGRTFLLPGPVATPQGAALSAPVSLAGVSAASVPLADGIQPDSTTTATTTATSAATTAGATGVPASGAPSATSAPGIDISAMTPVQAVTTAPPIATAASAATATPTAAPPVADQVFGEVSRLVSRGDGTHRLTMTLSPEALGDVRVTLTLRNGEVTVDFAAGDEARRALLESAPELRRLLELTGASESRVTVRDGAGPGAGQAHDGPSTSGRGADEAHRDQDHHAGTRDGENAMDGNHRGPGDTRLPHDPVRSTRAAGLDLTL